MQLATGTAGASATSSSEILAVPALFQVEWGDAGRRDRSTRAPCPGPGLEEPLEAGQ